MSRNILDYFKSGLVVSSPTKQLHTRKVKQHPNVVFAKIIGSFKKSLDYTQVYPVTLTMNRKKKAIEKMNDRQLHIYIIDRLKKNRSWKKVNYIVFPEYDKHGRLHYHGVIYGVYQVEVSNCIRFWRNTFGFVDREFMKEIKYKKCSHDHSFVLSDCEYIQKKIVRKGCWFHYCIKDTQSSGLWTMYNFT